MSDLVYLEAGIDAGLLWHAGNPFVEQKALGQQQAVVKLANRECFYLAGVDRHEWLNALTTQKIEKTQEPVQYQTLILDSQGHILHEFYAFDDGELLLGFCEPGRRQALLTYFQQMKFRMQVDFGEYPGLVIFDGAQYQILPKSTTAPNQLASADSSFGKGLAARQEVGIWAYEAWRIAAGVPRIFLDSDERTLPNELYVPDGERLGPAVHLKKGCYRGQETVAKVYNVGRPPRRLTKLHLDGLESTLPPIGSEIFHQDQIVGKIGASVLHYEEGPIALALLKRDVPLTAALRIGTVAVAQEEIVSPEVGLHVKFRSPLR